jgi:hypothetical protein
MPQNMNQLAKAANIGTLPVNDETTRELTRACEDIAAMRRMLMQALGMRLPEGPEPKETVTQTFTRAGNTPREPSP